MKNIYRVYDTYNGRMEWCLKKDLSDTINSMEAHLKARRMDYLALNPKTATLDDIDHLDDWCSDNLEIEKLQDEVPPFSFDEAREIIDSELDQPLKDVFTIIDRKPIAAGSLAQVHKAELKDGTTVAIKVQRPGIQKTVEGP